MEATKKRLWNYLDEEHGVSLLESDLDEIQRICEVEWISVDERLPDEEGFYLVFRKHPQKTAYRYDIESFKKNNKGKLFWYDYLFITHWQPLTPPKK